MDKKKTEYMASEKEVDKLIAEIGKLLEVPKETVFSPEEIRKSTGKLVEFLHYLVVCIKYLLFEIEATQREKEYFKNTFNRGD